MSEISIRWAQQGDAVALKSLLERSWRTHWGPHLESAAVMRYEDTRPVDGYVDAYLTRFRVAERDGALVGMYHLEDEHLHAIHVDLAAIGSGVGRVMMEAAEREGARKLEVRAFNRRAHEFYLRRGWVGTKEHDDLEMGQKVRTIVMERPQG